MYARMRSFTYINGHEFGICSMLELITMDSSICFYRLVGDLDLCQCVNAMDIIDKKLSIWLAVTDYLPTPTGIEKLGARPW